MENPLPAIPPKRYFTIGEVSELCGVKPYVLRYWEQEFTQLRPMKRRGNRRYYQHHEVLLIRRIRDLLYEQGFTISGARNRLLDSSSASTEDDHRDADLPDDPTDAPDAPSDIPAAPNGLVHEPAPLVAGAQLDTGSLDEPVDDQPVVSGHVPVPVDPPAVAAPVLQPHTLPTSAALLRQELELIRDLLDTGANDQFADILSVSVGA
jgi:DNA-binding transcriptional MerR regulator